MMKDREIKLVTKPERDTCAKSAPSADQSRVHRATRYEISAPARYRIRGEKEWRSGVMKNMSISGVLFGAPLSLPLETNIEMRFALPIQLAGGESAAEVFCRGSVVRTWKSAVPGEAAAMMAARITHSRFLRQQS
jgi:hypothetical protein